MTARRSSRTRPARTTRASRTRRPAARTRKPSPARAKRARPRPTSAARAGAGRAAGPRAKSSPARPAAAARARRAATGAIGLVMHHMDYSSHDVEQVRRFYTETLGFRDFNFDTRFSYLWVRTGPSSSIGFMPPLPGPPEQWRPPREPSIHFVVEDVDRVHRELAGKGVTFEQAPADMPWGHRTAVLRDPEGRLLCFSQPIAGKKDRA